MSEVTYEPVAGGESVADVAANYDFDGSEYGAPADEAETWTGPSREEWEQFRAGYGALQEWARAHHAARAQVADEEAQAYWQERLDPLSPDHDPAAIVELVQALAEEQTAPMRAYLEQLAGEQEYEAARDHAGEIMASLGVPEDAHDSVYDRGSALIDELVEAVGVEDVGALAAWLAEQRGIDEGQASLLIAQQVLAHAADEYRAATAPRPDSIAEYARERLSGLPPRDPQTGRFVPTRSPRPDSLKDIARRYSAGGR